MAHETALIIIDSGFSKQALARASRIIAVNDLPSGRIVVAGVDDAAAVPVATPAAVNVVQGQPLVHSAEQNADRSSDAALAPTLAASDLDWFAGDPMHHGTVVLERLMDRVPDMPVILVRALGEGHGKSFMRTTWNDDGSISTPGWTEAYRWAVDLCRKLGMRSVANFSFGSFIHAADGTGWEAHQVSQATGPGHIAVVAAGPGDGRAQHASWRQLAGETIVVSAQQFDDARYNFWSGAEAGAQWRLTVRREGFDLYVFDSESVPRNMWNGRKQQTFFVPGSGRVQLILELGASGVAADGVNEGALRFDVWGPGDQSVCFLDRIDLSLISEPAIFPSVLACGLRRGVYAPDQTVTGAKPEVLLPGGEQISFRIPEVTAAVALMLRDSNEDLDVVAVRDRLGKFPDLP